MDNRLQEHRLWYSKPAKEWNEALPVGNGRLGAMVFGGVSAERLQLNEDSLWYGGPRDRNNPDALPNLTELRKLILEGRLEGSGGAGLASPSRTSGNAAPLPSARRSSPDV